MYQVSKSSNLCVLLVFLLDLYLTTAFNVDRGQLRISTLLSGQSTADKTATNAETKLTSWETTAESVVSPFSAWTSLTSPSIVHPHCEYPRPLYNTTFNTYVYGHNKAVLVEFYSSFCGYCKRLAPRYETFAHEVKEWYHVVKIAKVNCELTENLKLCRKHKAKTYPTFRYFEPNGQLGDDGLHIPIENSDKLTPKNMKSMVLKHLNNTLDCGRAPPSWPDTRTMIVSSDSDLFQKLPKNMNKSLVYIVHSKRVNEPLLGPQVILDLSRYENQLNIISFLDETGSVLGETDGVDIGVYKLIDAQRRLAEPLKGFSIDPSWTEVEEDTNMKLYRNCTKNIIKRNVMEEIDRKPVQPLTFVDLFNAIRHSLHHNVRLRPQIEPSGVDILIEYVNLIVRYLPFKEDNKIYKPRLFKLGQWLKSKRGQTIKIEDYDKVIESEDYAPSMRPYIKCNGSTPDFRGYPCALWSLFHTLTISENNQLQKSRLGQHTVLYVMRKFIGEFFTCKSCARHFTKMSEELVANKHILTEPNSSVLWLWKAHNKVNNRLQCDLSEDPESPKLQFPTKVGCPECYTQDNKFIEERVFEYLSSYYSEESILM